MSMWEVLKGRDTLSIVHPGEDTVVHIDDYTDERFARALCHVLNSVSIHDLSRAMEDMTQSGVPEIL